MTLAAADFKIAGTITGTGPVLIVDHTTDNTLVTFRFQPRRREDVGGGAGVRGRRAASSRPARSSLQNADRAALEPSIKELGLSAWAVARRAGRADARSRRAADRLHPHLDQHAGRRLGPHGARQRSRCPTPTSPTTWCARATCKQKYDVIIFPHAGGDRQRPRLRRRPGQRAAAVQEDGGDAASRHPGFDRRHARRPRLRRPAGADEVRAAGRRADHRGRHRPRSSRSST